MIIPEDGCLPIITSSNLNAFNNIMVVKVDSNWKNPSESTFRLATLDRSKKGTKWPADNYVSKLIPSLPEIKIYDEQTKAYESRKELNLSLKAPGTRPKLFQRTDQHKHQLPGTFRPNSAGKKNRSDRSGSYNNRLQPKSDANDIEPWIQKPPCLLDGGNGSIHPMILTDGPNNFSSPNNNYFFGPPGPFDGVPKFSNAFPPSSVLPQGNYQFPRSRPNRPYRYPRNTAARGSRHDSSLVAPYNSYMEEERDNLSTNFMYEPSYSNTNMRKTLLSFPDGIHDNYIPNHDPSPHSSFEELYDQEINDDVGTQRNNFNNISYKQQYPDAKSRKRRRNNNYSHHGRNSRTANPRGNVNSSIPRDNGNSLSRGNRNNFKPGGRTTTQGYRNKKPWMANNQNKQNSNHKNAYRNF